MRTPKASAPRATARRPFRLLPFLESLEDRTLMTANPASAGPFAVPAYVLYHAPGSASPLLLTTPSGFTPAQIRHAYGFDQITFSHGTVQGDGTGTTIAIVDAYDDPKMASDLKAFDTQFGLPGNSTDNNMSFFTKVNQNGSTSPLPAASGTSGWAEETSLDVEWAHAIAPKAKILLVEANSANTDDLFKGVDTANNWSGVVAVSMSFGTGEFLGENASDSHFTHANITYLVASGDNGAPPSYPSASPNVVSVGGTTLQLDSSNNWSSETGWSGSGGGVSAYESQPSYQSTAASAWSTTQRTNPDVAYNADANTGYPIYDSYDFGNSFPWTEIGGTSAAAPQWAALIAIADQGRNTVGLTPLSGSDTSTKLYNLPARDFHDITSGSSLGFPSYTAGTGYDLVTGIGSPYADRVVNHLSNYAITGPPVIDLNWSGGGISGPTTASSQTPVTLGRTYTISGAAATGGFTIAYYASTDNVFGNADDVLLGTETISAAGDVAVGTHSGTSPALTLPSGGTFYLFAQLDSTGAIDEINESNNVTQAPQQVVVSGPVLMDNGQPGYAETGSGWTDYAAGYNGGLRFHAPGGGADTASWQATGLPAGYYTVQATWNASSNHASNAPYAIYDGNTLLRTVTVDQRSAPSGTTTLSGVVFQNLASVYVSSGTLRVILSDNVDGYVVADAVHLVPIPAPVVDLNWSSGAISGPTTAMAQASFTMSRTYNVSGAAAPGSFVIAYYASTDNVFGNADDVLLGTETISAAADLAQGSHSGTSPALSVPTAGTYYLFAKLDSADTILETNETNNVAQAPQQVVVSGPLLIDNGQPGYSETGTGWTDYAAGYNGGLRFHAPGTGADTASWQTTNLPAGYYTVQATWNASSNHASNASYAIYDGNTLLRTVTVDQRSAPSGTTTLGGVVFQDLATVRITSGTLRVVVADNTDGYVVADAIHLVPVAAPTVDLNWSGGGLVSQATAATQTPFTVSRTYTVSGAAPAANFVIAYYASTDTVFGNADDVLLGTETISAAADKAVGVHAGVSPAFSIAAGGTYYLFAKVDSTDVVLETDETNNVAQAPQPIAVTVPLILDNGQTGYSETGSGWTSYAAGYNGGLRFHAPGGGADTAVWQVSGLAPGYYTVQATWNGGNNHASNAPYAIYDGATLLSTATLDQRPAPSGAAVGGVVFQDLATIIITSGTVRVVLADNTDGYVVADAVRLVPIPTLVVSGPTLLDNGQPGYGESGSAWTDYAAGYNGGLRFHAPGGGADTATWQATGLPAGYYTVQVTWNASSNHASNAPYAIYDGNTLLRTVIVNQQSAPSGTTLGGVVFQNLVSVHITSGTLRVVLSDNVDAYVVADAVNVVPIPAPAVDLNWSGGGITGPTTASAQSSFTINRTYKVSGAAAGGSFVIAYYASTDAVFGNADDVLLGTETISAPADLAVGSHSGTSPALTIPTGGTYYLFAKLDSNDTVLEADETNNVAQAPATVANTGPVLLDNGQPGYTETGSGWASYAAGYGNSLRYHAAGSGADTAVWQATGLPTGYYTVQATWNASSNHASNAPYAIYDGTTLLGTVTVDQRPAPSGTTTLGGVVFQDLATVYIASGTVRVVLADNTDGYVVADAVRLAPAAAPGHLVTHVGSGPTFVPASGTGTPRHNAFWHQLGRFDQVDTAAWWLASSPTNGNGSAHRRQPPTEGNAVDAIFEEWEGHWADRGN
jgi:hypothetical protein